MSARCLLNHFETGAAQRCLYGVCKLTLNRKSVAVALIAGAFGGAANAYLTAFAYDAGAGGPVMPSMSKAAEAQFVMQLASPLVGNTYTETFEGSANGATGDVPLNLGGAGVASLKAKNGQVRNTQLAGQYGLPGGSGPNYWSVDITAGASDAFEVDFGQTMAAFSFYGIDIGDAGGALSLNLFLGTSLVGTVPVDQVPLGDAQASILFFGLVAQNKGEFFDRVVFSYNAPPDPNGFPRVDQMAFDNLTVARAVVSTIPPGGTIPEPGTLLLVASAALGLRLSKRRRA